MAIGSLVADSTLVIEVAIVSIERERKMENAAEASVEEIMEHNNKDVIKSHLK